jgi:hypothetical protein
MAGYNPTCNSCYLCMTCRGAGTITSTGGDVAPGGKWVVWHEKKECPTCKGVGGKPCGKHD